MARAVKGDTEEESETRTYPELEKMFQRRFSYCIETEKPDTEAMVIWLADRCEEFGLNVEAPKVTLRRLAERSQHLPGMSLQVLNKAHKRRSKTLTQQLVEEHVFDFDA